MYFFNVVNFLWRKIFFNVIVILEPYSMHCEIYFMYFLK